ncbi:E3 ubiquitin protein ligase [Aphelenchoides bicaudatus]|nr:E3 ubiquitin protein ligase [Aphelenchoides bicaudatus]
MGSNEDGPPSKRARLVIFEPIKVQPASNAKDLNANILPAQHFKLSERFRAKQRHIASLEKRIDELENRHSSDDELICIINRQWNQAYDIMADLIKRFVDEGNMSETVDNNRSETNWLTVLSQLNNDEIAQRLESRTNFSKEALTYLLKAMNSYSQKRDRIMALLDPSSKNQNSPNAEDSRDGIEATQDSTDSGAEKPDIDAVLRQELMDLASENKRLEALVVQLKSQKSSLSTKVAAHNDEIELMEAKVENVNNQVEELRFELEKSIAHEEKLETQIIEMKRNEHQALAQAASTSQQQQLQKDVKPIKQEKTENNKADISQTQLDELQHDLELQVEICEKRLSEIQALNNQNQELSSKVMELENVIKFLPTSVISVSPDYICLRLKYTHLVDESRRLDEGNRELRDHIADLRQTYEDSLKQIKNEFTTAMGRMQENCANLSNELLDVKKEYTKMELEYKQKYETDCIEAESSKDSKVLIATARAEAQRRASEVERMKKIINDLKAELKKAKEDLEEARKIGDSVTDNPVPVPPPPGSDKKAKVEARAEKPGTSDRTKRQLQALTEQNERLKRELNAANEAEKGLMREMESTAQAVEDLMNQNAKLQEKVDEHSTSHIRQVKEGLQNETTLRLLKQNIEILEEKLRFKNNEFEALRIECTTLEAKAEMCKNINNQLEATLRKNNAALETFRRNCMNTNTDLAEMKVRFEKQTAELQDSRQQMKERVESDVASRTKVARLREERNQLRKKLSRAKQASEYDNIDELLQHENKVLRDALICPTCKTNDKNTILTKCYHVFCGDCIKKRYDVRNRKCPKCNAGFGANDFHRIYLS